MGELISVIVPVYNAEKYIKKCIESIISQTYQNMELILINDGSKDLSLQICEEFAKKDQRIKVYDRANGGASAARNTGLTKARGDYIVFVDSDDFVTSTYLENLYLAAKIGNYDIVQCNLEEVNNTKLSINNVTFDKMHVQEISKKQALNDRVYKVTIWGKIYSSFLFDDFKFREGEIYEDDASYYIFVDKAKKIAVLNETLYYYYMSENSVMRNDKKDISNAFIEIYEERIQYFKEKDEVELLDGTYDRFCLVLMLNISASFQHKNNLKDREKWIALFKQYYSLIKKSKFISKKDKAMFLLFRVSPKIAGKIIGKIRG